MKNLPVIIVSIMIVVIAGLFIYNSNKNDSISTETKQETMSPEPTVMTSTSFTLDDVSGHDKKEDCWLAIEGKVYDVTEFIASSRHPGRDAILQGCGKDATELFNTRPMGSKTPHSNQARGMLGGFEIGVLSP